MPSYGGAIAQVDSRLAPFLCSTAESYKRCIAYRRQIARLPEYLFAVGGLPGPNTYSTASRGGHFAVLSCFGFLP